MNRYPYINEWRTVGAYYVHKFSVAATNAVIYSSYERKAGHSSFMTHPELGEWVGSVSSRPLPAEIECLNGHARYVACDVFRAKNEADALAAIVAAYPEADRGTRNGMGEIEIYEATVKS